MFSHRKKNCRRFWGAVPLGTLKPWRAPPLPKAPLLSAKRSLLKLQGFPGGLSGGPGRGGGGCLSQAGGLLSKLLHTQGKKGISVGITDRKLTESGGKSQSRRLVPRSGLRAPPFSSLLPPSRGPRLPRRLPPPSLALPSGSRPLRLPSNPRTLSLSPSLALSRPHCLWSSFSSLSGFLLLSPLNIYTDPFIPASPRPAEVCSQREGPGIRVPHSPGPHPLPPDRHLLGLPPAVEMRHLWREGNRAGALGWGQHRGWEGPIRRPLALGPLSSFLDGAWDWALRGGGGWRRSHIPAAWRGLRAGGLGTMVGIRGWETEKCATLERRQEVEINNPKCYHFLPGEPTNYFNSEP